VRSADRAGRIEALGATAVTGDIREPESFADPVRRADAVIHAAQLRPAGRLTRRTLEAMHAADAVSTRALAAACLAQRKPLIYSSGALAHAAGGDGRVGDALAPRPCRLAAGHAAMVRELAVLHRELGLAVQVVTPGFVCGPGGFLPQTVDLLRRGRYRIVGTGTNTWSLIHADDLAEVYVLALERGQAGSNHFAGDDVPAPRSAVVERLAEALGAPRPGRVPAWLAGLVLGFPLVEALQAPCGLHNGLVKARLGWRPRYRSVLDELPALLRDLAP
jgi:nucleoside-diphosphate-sugar epimerase